MTFIHESAHVSTDAILADDVKVWINSQIRENAKIGENTIISKDTYIDEGVIIGCNVKIQNGVSVYKGVSIEDDVLVGPNAVFTNDYFPRATNVNWEITPTLIKKGASLGANSTVVCGNIIGKYAMVGAGSVVISDIPDHALVVGNPARVVGYVCECGNRLNTEYHCVKCGKNYTDIKENK